MRTKLMNSSWRAGRRLAAIDRKSYQSRNRIAADAMKARTRSIVAAVAALAALALTWPAPSEAQPSGCYKACQLPTKSVSVPAYFVCLGVRAAGNCAVCPGHLGGGVNQVVAGNSLSCFKACAKGYAWNLGSRSCCPQAAAGNVQTPAAGAADNQSVEVVVSPPPGGGHSRVRVLYRTFKQHVQAVNLLPMTRSEKWVVLKKNMEALRKAADRIGVLVAELDAESNSIMRAAPAGTTLDQRQTTMLELARAAAPTTGVTLMVGPAPPMLENALIGDPSCPTEPLKIAVAFDGGASKVVTRTRIEVKPDKAVWRGTVDGSDAQVSLLWWPSGRLAGAVHDGNRLYSIRHMGGPVYTVVEMSGERMPNEHAPMPARLRINDPSLRDDPLIQQGDASLLRSVTAAMRPLPRLLDAPKAEAKKARTGPGDVVIDVIVAYTAKAALNYINIHRELIELAIEEGNESFRISGLGHIRLRLVHAYQTDYVEEGAHFDHVWRFADRGDGFMEEIHGLRNKYRGDVAILIVDDPRGCGLATRVYADADEAFAVVHHDCAALTYTVPHEIGHLIGARHDLTMDKVMTPFQYGHGYVNGTKWRDIMSYRESCNGCPRIPVWSSPKVLIKGEPAGSAGQDNARVLLEQAARVAGFR